MPTREISWSFLLLVVVCACAIATGFFFAAQQHFTSMDYGIKNSRLRDQLQDLETEKRRLLLAREVALSPLSIRKAASAIGLRQRSEMAKVQNTEIKPMGKNNAAMLKPARTVAAKSSDPRVVIRTVLSTPVQSKSAGETRGRVVDTSKDKKEKTEVAALVKLR